MSQHTSRLTTALVVGALILASSATLAADLARQSRIGAIFADQPPPRYVRVERDAPSRDAALVVVEALYPIQPRLPGYYGSPRDFEYRNYYGTSPVTIFSRLPYACGFVASC